MSDNTGSYCTQNKALLVKQINRSYFVYDSQSRKHKMCICGVLQSENYTV